MTGHAVFVGVFVRTLGAGELLTTGMHMQFLSQKALLSFALIH